MVETRVPPPPPPPPAPSAAVEHLDDILFRSSFLARQMIHSRQVVSFLLPPFRISLLRPFASIIILHLGNWR